MLIPGKCSNMLQPFQGNEPVWCSSVAVSLSLSPSLLLCFWPCLHILCINRAIVAGEPRGRGETAFTCARPPACCCSWCPSSSSTRDVATRKHPICAPYLSSGGLPGNSITAPAEFNGSPASRQLIANPCFAPQWESAECALPLLNVTKRMKGGREGNPIRR